MNNLHAYLKLCAYEKKVSVKKLAEIAETDSTYISRILNRKIQKPNNHIMEKISHYLGLNQVQIKRENSRFNALYHNYLHTVYFIEREKRRQFYEEIVSMKLSLSGSSDIIRLMMVQFIQKAVLKQYDEDFSLIQDKLYYIHESLDDFDQKLFLTFYIGVLDTQSRFKDISKLISQAENIFVKDGNLNMMLSYYIFSYGTKINSLTSVYSYHQKCSDYLKKTNNVAREFNLEIIYSNYLMQLGYIEEAIKTNLAIIHRPNIKSKYSYTYDVLLNNTAWAYLLNHNYDHALKYYLQISEKKRDNDIFFYISWCYYQLGMKEKAMEYIEKGKFSKKHSDFYYLFLEWLEAMIQKKYSKKSYQLLMKIYKQYGNDLQDDVKNFVLIELINYYCFNHLYKEAYEISKDLINRHCISTTYLI